MEIAHAAHDAPGDRRTPSKWTLSAVVGIGVFMCTLDTSIVNVSLPAITEYFHAHIGAEVEWVMIAYLVVIAASLLTIGRLSDHLGRRSIWRAGLVLFTLGSALCGAAPTLWFLIGARGLQGIGGAMLLAVSPAMFTAAFPSTERGRALGINATIVALGFSAGPALGGLITAQSNWRWVFYVNVPIGIIGLVATTVLPRDRGARTGSFDVLGALALGVGFGALTVALSLGNTRGWLSPVVLVVAAIAVVAIAVYAWDERHNSSPLIARDLLHNRVFVWANVGLVLSFIAAFATSFLLPFYFERVHGFGPLRTGLMMTPFPLVVAVVAPITGSLADRVGTRGLTIAGMTFLCLGLALLSRLDTSTSTVGMIWPQMVAALGQGLFQAPNNSTLMGAAPPSLQGVAAGTLATSRTIGATFSLAIAGAVLASHGARAVAGVRRSSEEVLAGVHDAFLVCAAIAAVGIVSSWYQHRRTPTG
jgi:EmrB/QacA subfamily drug resistance transporter